MKSFVPCTTGVVVKRVDAEQKPKSGIIIPDTAQGSPRRAKVVARRLA